MPTNGSLNLKSVPSASLSLASAHAPNVQSLNALAAQGLVSMFDREKQLFCYRVVRTGDGLQREGLSPRYTIMTLLGLRKLEEAGGHSFIDTNAVYESLVRDITWVQGIGDLGLLLWLTATFSPDRLEVLFRVVNLDTALDRYADARAAKTMELSWFLTGLAMAAKALPDNSVDLTDLSVETYRLLENNQGESGFFGHLSTTRSLAGLVRGRIGSFADQIYPIFALTKFAMAFHVDESLSAALECASAICSVQGKLGQWWWLYDAKEGRVSSPYPVYSVHQHGMAPMGLLALQEAVGRSFEEPICLGLRWIERPNELDVDMRDVSRSVIWRCICLKHSYKKYWGATTRLFRDSKIGVPAGQLKVLFEDRPYESGWLLYALGGFGN